MDGIRSYNPYDFLPKVPSFALESKTLTNMQPFGIKQVNSSQGGYDLSPDLNWVGFPETVQSFALTMYDPDAPTASGYWHWAAFNIPRDITGLPEGAGTENNPFFPRSATTLENDANTRGYLGPAPPKGHGLHRYFIVVHALNVEKLDISAKERPATLGFHMFGCTLARATLVGLWEYPDDLEEPNYA